MEQLAIILLRNTSQFDAQKSWLKTNQTKKKNHGKLTG